VSWQYLEQNWSGDIGQRFVAELARFCGVQASVSGVIVLAREALVEVETLLLLGATFEQVELAQLHDLWRLCVVREHTVMRTFRTFSEHEKFADLGRLFDRSGIPWRSSVCRLFEILLHRSLMTFTFVAATFALGRRTGRARPSDDNKDIIT
jgi:hypothetical protein